MLEREGEEGRLEKTAMEREEMLGVVEDGEHLEWKQDKEKGGRI